MAGTNPARLLQKVTSPTSFTTWIRSIGKNWRDQEDSAFLQDLDNTRQIFVFVCNLERQVRALAKLQPPLSTSIDELAKQKTVLAKALSLAEDVDLFSECSSSTVAVLKAYADEEKELIKLTAHYKKLFATKDGFRNAKFRYLSASTRYEKAQKSSHTEQATKAFTEQTKVGKELAALRNKLVEMCSFGKLACNEFLERNFDRNLSLLRSVGKRIENSRTSKRGSLPEVFREKLKRFAQTEAGKAVLNEELAVKGLREVVSLAQEKAKGKKIEDDLGVLGLKEGLLKDDVHSHNPNFGFS